MEEYIKRDMEDTFLAVSKIYSGVFLTGPRQVGKSTMLKHLAGAERGSVTLDDLGERSLAKNDPRSFLNIHRPPVVIDEVQYAPELFPYIKMAIDNGAPPGSFWLTGSQSVRLMRLAGESMAGRVALLEMGPLSQNETCGKASNFPFTIDREEIIHRMSGRAKEGEDEIFERIYEGSLPGYVGKCDRDERFRDVFFASYARLYLDRDVREEIPGINMSLFYDFLRGVACLVGQTLNVHALALDVGVSDDTAKRWLSVLEKSGIIFYLNSYSNNLLTRTVKMKKVYFFDTGVAAYLTRQASPGIMRDSPYCGAILENYVISEIRKTYMNSGRQFDMYYYRDVNSKEIDLILEEGGKLHPVEIKKNSFPTRAMVSNFSVLRKSSVPTGEGAVICMNESFSVLDDGTLVVPVWAI